MLCLQLFGGLGAYLDDQPLAGRAVQRKRLALLALLAAAPRRAVSRDKLICLLWPESSSERARHQLTAVVHDLRKAVGADSLPSSGEELRLNPQRVHSDLWEFEKLVAGGDAERAVELYAGPFLDGFFLADAPEFERWVETERDRLARSYAQALERIAEEKEAAGDFRGASLRWRQLCSHDPFCSRIALRLMRALECSGDRGGALQHAQAHTTLLHEELGVEPDEEVSALAARLRSAPARRSETWKQASPAGPSHAPGPQPRLLGAQALKKGTHEPSPLPASSASPHPLRAIRGRFGSRTAAVAMAVVLLLIVGGLRTGGTVGRPGAGGGGDVRSLAVLPLENCTPDPRRAGRPDPEQEYFADGLTDALITELAQIPGLHVTSRTSSMKYRGECGSRARRDKSLPEIARELGVEAVVEGTLMRDGNRVRINAQLIRAATDEHLWADGLEYERDVRDVLVLQGDIASAIAREVRLRASPDRTRRQSAARPVNPTAYELYLKGRDAWNRRTEATLDQAVRHFQRSIAHDSTFALAYVGLADAYYLLPLYTDRAAKDWYPLAKEAARRALALDSTLAPAHATLGGVAVFEWDWKAAEAFYRRAIQLDPNYSTARQWYAELLTIEGRYPEALREARRAQRLDPLSPMIGTVIAWTLMADDQLDAAERELLEILEREPNFAPANVHLGHAWAQQGRYAEAIAQYRRAGELTGNSSMSLVGHIHAQAGDTAKARAVLDELTRRSEVERIDPLSLARLHTILGDRERALNLLEQAYRETHVGLTFLGMSRWCDPLRSHPRFRTLMQRIGLEDRSRSAPKAIVRETENTAAPYAPPRPDMPRSRW